MVFIMATLPFSCCPLHLECSPDQMGLVNPCLYFKTQTSPPIWQFPWFCTARIETIIPFFFVLVFSFLEQWCSLFCFHKVTFAKPSQQVTPPTTLKWFATIVGIQLLRRCIRSLGEILNFYVSLQEIQYVFSMLSKPSSLHTPRKGLTGFWHTTGSIPRPPLVYTSSASYNFVKGENRSSPLSVSLAAHSGQAHSYHSMYGWRSKPGDEGFPGISGQQVTCHR